jgi:hypothetical protein
MTRLLLPPALAALPGTAFAHAGPHLHPHGIGEGAAIVAVASLAAALTWLVLSRR